MALRCHRVLRRALSQSPRLANRLRAFYDRRILQRALGEAGRLRLLRALHWQHHRVRLRRDHVRKRRVYDDV